MKKFLHPPYSSSFLNINGHVYFRMTIVLQPILISFFPSGPSTRKITWHRGRREKNWGVHVLQNLLLLTIIIYLLLLHYFSSRLSCSSSHFISVLSLEIIIFWSKLTIKMPLRALIRLMLLCMMIRYLT